VAVFALDAFSHHAWRLSKQRHACQAVL